MMHTIGTIIFVGFVQLFLACSTMPPPVVTPSQAPPPPQALPQPPAVPMVKPVIKDTPLAPAPKKDEELFLQGMQQLADQLGTQSADGPARQTFETLTSTYPNSKWRDAAQVCMRLLGIMDADRDRIRAEQRLTAMALSDHAKSIQEIEQLKKDLRALGEKYQADLTALQQENEQLKKDIQLLKNLEMQRDRREKMLR